MSRQQTGNTGNTGNYNGGGQHNNHGQNANHGGKGGYNHGGHQNSGNGYNGGNRQNGGNGYNGGGQHNGGHNHGGHQNGGKNHGGDNRRLLPESLIRAAAKGDVEAINKVLKHYEGYIIALSMKPVFDEQGRAYTVIDNETRRTLETKLIVKITKFDPEYILRQIA